MASGYNRRSNLWLPVLYIVIALSHCRSVLFHLQNVQGRLLANLSVLRTVSVLGGSKGHS